MGLIPWPNGWGRGFFDNDKENEDGKDRAIVMQGVFGLRMVLFQFLALGGLIGGGGLPPRAEDPVLSKAAPAECLFYATWAETGTADPKSKNHVEQLLANPEVRKWVVDMQTRMTKMRTNMPQSDPDDAQKALLRLAKAIEGKAGAAWLTDWKWRQEPGGVGIGPGEVRIERADVSAQFQGAALLRVENEQDQKEISTAIQALLAQDPDGIESKEEMIGKFPFSRVQIDGPFPSIHWGFAGKYLVLGIGDGEAEAAMKRARGEVPAWLSQARKDLAVPRVANLVHVDLQALLARFYAAPGMDGSLQPKINALGFDALDTYTVCRGMDAIGCLDRWQLAVKGEPRGVLSLIDTAALRIPDLKVIDLKSPAAVAFQLDLGKLLDVYLEVAAVLDPVDQSREVTGQQIAQIEQMLGMRLREDLLASLGDSWKVFAQSGPTGLTTGWTAALEIRDAERFRKLHTQLLERLRPLLTQAGAPNLETTTIEGTEVHTIKVPVPGVPLAPCWCVTDKELLFAAVPDTLRVLLERKKDAASLADTPLMRRTFASQPKPLLIAHIDTRAVAETLLDLYPHAVTMGLGGPMGVVGNSFAGGEEEAIAFPKDAFLAHLRPSLFALQRTPQGLSYTGRHTLHNPASPGLSTMVSMFAPAVVVSRAAAQRNQSIYNVKQLELALLNFESATKRIPAGYSADADGKPLLSWRVHILPFLEGAELYDQFHLDEPWDSPHNKTLIEKMPSVFRSPRSKAEAGKTNYLGVGGADGVFVRPEPGKNQGIQIGEISDGTSKTISIVEASDELAITWTQPGDFAPDKENPMKGLGGLHSGNIVVAGFMDGHVSPVSLAIDAGTFMAMCTKSGNEAVNLDMPAPNQFVPAIPVDQDQATPPAVVEEARVDEETEAVEVAP